MRFTRAKSWEELQERASSAFADLESHPLYDGVLLEDVALSAAAITNVAHKLGRKARWWIVLDSTAAATFFRNGAGDTRFLPIQASAATTVKLLVG